MPFATPRKSIADEAASYNEATRSLQRSGNARSAIEARDSIPTRSLQEEPSGSMLFGIAG